MSRILISLLSLFCISLHLQAAEMIPFELPWDDDKPAFTDVSGLLEKPAGNHGFIRAEGERFVDGEGKPIRLLGVNTAFSGNFPSHEQAEKIAARMAKFGINAVRIHHLDTSRSPNGIWLAGISDKQRFDPERLDRLDYFIAQLKKNGVYTNLNLKVGRKTVEADRVPFADQLPTYDKGPDHFYPRLIELQKAYAQDLLTHVNPYTGMDYLNDPAIVTIELNNESGLIWQWANRSLDALPQGYVDVLQADWNAFLRQKYQSTSQLEPAWKPQSQGDGKEMLRHNSDRWVFQTIGEAEGSALSLPGDYEKRETIRMTITQTGSEPWHVQMFYPKLVVQKGEYYQAKLILWSDSSRTVSVGLQQDHEPWQFLDDPVSVQLTSERQEFDFSFVPNAGDSNVRLILSGMGNQKGKVMLVHASLKNQAPEVFDRNESLEEGTVGVVFRKDYGAKTHACQRDWMAFLLYRETQYNQEMYDYVKQELGAKPMVTGTQIGFAPFHSQVMHDLIDTHGYFNHPHFPNRPWDAEDWYVENESIVHQEENVLIRLLQRQVAGKPFTVSEYNHPAPMPFASEAIPLTAAYGAAHGWDGIYYFAYSHNNRYDQKSINSFFDIAGHTPKMVCMPAAANLLLRGDIEEAAIVYTSKVDSEKMVDFLTENNGGLWNLNRIVNHPDSGIHPVLTGKTVIDLHANPRGSSPAASSAQHENIVWNLTAAGYVLIRSPKTKGFIGFHGATTYDLHDGMQLEIGETQKGWANVLLTWMKTSKEGSHWLLTATGYSENQGMRWKDERKNSVGRNWGAGPPLVEPVPLRLIFSHPDAKKRIRAYPLDERGNRMPGKGYDSLSNAPHPVLNLNQTPASLWYEIVIPQTP